MDRLVTIAAELLRGSEQYTEDARQGAPVGNSVVGSLLSLQHGAPRRNAEAAVVEALRIVDREREAEDDAARALERMSAETHTLTRSANAPLKFSGELLAEVDGQRQLGRDQNRWFELAVYRTPKGTHVLRIAYRTRWEGEAEHDFAAVLAEPAQVARVLEEYDPLAHVQGYPVGQHYDEKNARLRDNIRTRYEALVSELLACDEAFAERVE